MAAGPTGPTAVSSNRTHPITPRGVRSYVRSGVLLGGRKADCGEHSVERCHLSARAIVLFERRSSTRTIAPLRGRPFSGRKFWARLISRYKPTYRSGLLAFVSGLVPTGWDRKAFSRRQEIPRQREAANTSGLLAFVSGSVPTGWDQKAFSRRQEIPRQWEVANTSSLLAFVSGSVPTGRNRTASPRRQETPRQWEVPNTQYGDGICGDLWKNTPADVPNAGLRWNQRGTSSPPCCKPILQNQK